MFFLWVLQNVLRNGDHEVLFDCALHRSSSKFCNKSFIGNKINRFVGDDKVAHVGTPVLEKAVVEGKVVAQDRHDKVKGIKHNPKKRYLVRFGHRQAYTEVQITKIAA